MKKQTIKIFDTEIDTTMSLEDVLKICKTKDTSINDGLKICKTKDISINDGEDVEETNYRVIHVRKDINKTSKVYEIIFHKGKIQSVERWGLQIIYSAIPIEDVRVMVIQT